MTQGLKNTMIERIVARYVALNESDYADGNLDERVKDDCNNYAKAFGKTLESVSDESVSKFYVCSRNIQNKVFSYDSACWAASMMPRPMLKTAYDTVVSDMHRYGFDKISFIMEIMTPHLDNLKNMLNAEYHDLGDGVIAYTGLNGARI